MKINSNITFVPPQKNQEPSSKPTKTSTTQKILTVTTDFPHFSPSIALSNRHGIGIFGFEKTGGYGFYWISPKEERAKRIECVICERYRDGGTSIAESKDGKIKFHYTTPFNRYGKHYLNGEEAQLFSAPTFEGPPLFSSMCDKIKRIFNRQKHVPFQ